MTNRDILDELRVRGELAERLKRMAPRYREIITLRYGLSFETGLIVRGEMTMEQVAKLYSITTERLRQIEKKVFKDLSEGLTDSPWHTGTPTEDGNYWVWCELIEDNCLPKSKRPYVGYWKDNEWWDIYTLTTIHSVLGADIVAWMPIEPYKGD